MITAMVAMIAGLPETVLSPESVSWLNWPGR